MSDNSFFYDLTQIERGFIFEAFVYGMDGGLFGLGLGDGWLYLHDGMMDGWSTRFRLDVRGGLMLIEVTGYLKHAFRGASGRCI